ncbi:uncharacterized protein VirK/YbjX [Oxalobacteraceae bacterium GrIS 1.11]
MKFWLRKWSLISAAWNAQDGVKSTLKVCLGTLAYPGSTQRWLRFIKSHPGLSGLVKSHPRLLYKIYRPYLSNNFACAGRVDVLMSHYDLLYRAGAGPVIEYAARRRLVLATVAGKTDTVYQLQLSAINDGHREGELCLWLTAGGADLYSVTFSLSCEQGKTSIRVGSLQGVRSEYAAQSIKDATRNLYGCRPRNLLVALVRDLGAYFGCSGTLLVSNRNRIAVNWRRRRQILANYDEMWREMHALQRPDGDFELSCHDFLPVDFEGVASKKRAEAKRRAALLQTIFDSVRACLDGMHDTAVAWPDAQNLLGQQLQ